MPLWLRHLFFNSSLNPLWFGVLIGGRIGWASRNQRYQFPSCHLYFQLLCQHLNGLALGLSLLHPERSGKFPQLLLVGCCLCLRFLWVPFQSRFRSCFWLGSNSSCSLCLSLSLSFQSAVRKGFCSYSWSSLQAAPPPRRSLRLTSDSLLRSDSTSGSEWQDFVRRDIGGAPGGLINRDVFQRITLALLVSVPRVSKKTIILSKVYCANNSDGLSSSCSSNTGCL